MHSICTPHVNRKYELILFRGRKTDSAPKFWRPGVQAAVTEAAAMCGFNAIPPGAPTTSSFIHGFFSIAQLGQFAREGVALLARWGIPQLLGLELGSIIWGRRHFPPPGKQ